MEQSNITAVMIGLFLLASCASSPVLKPPPAYDPALSRAMNVVIAAGEVTRSGSKILQDRSAEEWKRLGGAAPAVNRSGSAAVDVGYAASNVLNPPPGFSVGAAGAMSVLSLLSDLPVYEPGGWDKLFAWIPADQPLPAALYDANVHLRQTFIQVMAPGYTIALGPQTRLGDPGEAWLVGPGCPAQTCRFVVLLNRPAAEPVPFAPPAFLTQPGQVYGPLTGAVAVNKGRSSPVGVAALDTPPLERLSAFSAALPPWMYLYLAPRKGRNAVPLILNQGKTLYFIKPGDEAAAGLPAAGKPAG